jgi:hypothetical protein
MRILQCLMTYTAMSLCVIADPATERIAVLEEAARTAGIEKELVLDPKKRSELVESLRRRIAQGYFDEKAFWIALRKQNPPKSDYAELYRSYVETRGNGFDRALFLASKFGCVELLPLLVKRGDMKELDIGVPVQKGEDARAVKAIVAMGLKASGPLFEIVERSADSQERYYALSALKSGQTAWAKDLDGKGLAERMSEQCDTSKTTVQLALALLNGKIHDARTAAGEDLKSP